MRRMRWRFCGVVILALCLLVGSASAQRGFGLGIIVGEPTGLSGKLWLSKVSALDGAAAWSFVREAALHLHMDYLLHSFDLIKVEEGKLPLYYGIGGRLKLKDDDKGNDDDLKIGLRLPVGLEYLFKGDRVGLFLEVVPLLDLAPETDFTLNGGVGVRYYFH